MKLIVGLGNPGGKYRFTRHNIGASVVKKLAALNNISLRRQRYLSYFGEGRIDNETINIILPLTYMNLSGKAVSSIVKDRKIVFSDVLVICDDADLALGNIRIKPKGSSGGHKGLRSIIESCNTESFPRLRIGIGKKGDLKDHVLARFGRDEKGELAEVEEMAIEASLCWIREGIEQAMNVYNARRKAA